MISKKRDQRMRKRNIDKAMQQVIDANNRSDWRNWYGYWYQRDMWQRARMAQIVK